MTPQNQPQPGTQPKQHATPTHQALADYLAMLQAIPDGATVTVVQPAPDSNSLAAQLRAVLAAQSYYQGG